MRSLPLLLIVALAACADKAPPPPKPAAATDPWTDPSPHQIRNVRVNGGSLNVLDWGGTGDGMALIHGMTDSPHSFDDLVPAFTDGHRVIAYARRGHGQSDHPAAGPYDNGDISRADSASTMSQPTDAMLDSMVKSLFGYQRDYTKVKAPVLALHSELFVSNQLPVPDSARGRVVAWNGEYQAFQKASIARLRRELRAPLDVHVLAGTALRVLDLIETVLRDPFAGIGEPEPLKHLGGHVWSRRINEADRLVYEVFADRVEFLQARYHY